MTVIQKDVLEFFNKGVEHQPLVFIRKVAAEKRLSKASIREALWHLIAEGKVELSRRRTLKVGPRVRRKARSRATR